MVETNFVFLIFLSYKIHYIYMDLKHFDIIGFDSLGKTEAR